MKLYLQATRPTERLVAHSPDDQQFRDDAAKQADSAQRAGPTLSESRFATLQRCGRALVTQSPYDCSSGGLQIAAAAERAEQRRRLP